MMASAAPRSRPDVWTDAVLALRILAVDAAAVGGAVLRAGHGPVRDLWLEQLRGLVGPAAPVRRLPAQITEERLLGGLDLAATLSQGRPILQRGVLAASDHGLVVVPMAERLDRGIAARIAATLDTGEVCVERDGFSVRESAHVGVLLLDEGTDEQQPLPVLPDRLAIWLDLRAVALSEIQDRMPQAGSVAAARQRLPTVRYSDDALLALVTAAVEFGIESLRAPLLALQVARTLAALDDRGSVEEEDLCTAARLVLGPRATRIAAQEDREEESTDPASSAEPSAGDRSQAAGPDLPSEPAEQSAGAKELAEQVIAAAHAVIPADLLARLGAAGGRAPVGVGGGRVGMLRTSLRRGRPAGVRKGLPRPGIRLSVIDTLRAAAPWQRLRRAQRVGGHAARLQLRAEDFHVRRYQQRSETVTVFIVDASGSAAIHRLAEAKGAVELILAQCYVRRDRVAVIAFRNKGAEVLLPPTRSLVRARRSLAALAGGGGTPLAAAIHAANRMADASQRAGLTPTLVFLTDGRGNLTLSGMGNRAVAEQEARAAARTLRSAGWRSILIDTSPRPGPTGYALAGEMGGVYLPLPHADSVQMSRAVQRLSESAA